jgi:hypothetical protein
VSARDAQLKSAALGSPFLAALHAESPFAAPGLDQEFLSAGEEAPDLEDRETEDGVRTKLKHFSFFKHAVKVSGTDVDVTPARMDPGIYDGPVKYKIASDLQKCLNTFMDTDRFRHIRVALVDLTKDLLKPEFAGFSHKLPVFAASVPKMAAMLAAFQLRHDLRVAQKDKPATTQSELYGRVRDEWAATQGVPSGTKTVELSPGIALRNKLVLIAGKPVPLIDHFTKGQPEVPRSPRLERIFADSPAGRPVGIGFRSTGENSARLEELIDTFDSKDSGSRASIEALGFAERLRVAMGGLVPASNFATSTLVTDVGFPYIASTLLQSGLFDLNRKGGVWLGLDYGGHSWIAAPGGGSVQNATAGAAAALMTLLVQGRVTDTLSCREMRALIQKTPYPTTHPTLVSWFEEGLTALPGRGAIKTALSKLGVLDGLDDCAFIERTVDLGGGRTRDLRYVAVGLRARTKEELKKVILGLDKCILLNNTLTPVQGGHPVEREVASPGAWLESPSTDSESFDQEDPEFEHDVQPPTSPITIAALANGLTNLVYWARHPKQRGKKLTSGSTDAKAWTKLLAGEVAPALHADSTERRISQLIFFARHPDVRGQFAKLPKDRQSKLGKEFTQIRTKEVAPWLSLQIARGRVQSRTLYVVNDAVFKSLPARTRDRAGAVIAEAFRFVNGKAPMRVVVLEPDRFPESYNLSDAVVSVTDTIVSVHVNQAIRQQTKNVARTIRGLGGTLTLDVSRSVSVPDRVGTAVHWKFVATITSVGAAAIPIMASAVSVPEAITYINDEHLGGKDTIPKDWKNSSWTEPQQNLVGTTLGRAMAHEARHLYVPPHAAAGLGSDMANLFAAAASFSAADRTDILAAIAKSEQDQGTRQVITTYNADDRAGDFPF